MSLKLTNPLLHLRTISHADKTVLCEIYSKTRTQELEYVTAWTPEQKQEFLLSQFKAQHNYYQHNYKGAHFWVIEYTCEVIGRLYLHPDYERASMRIIDIAILPKWRNKGIGKQILADVMKHAAGSGRSVTIHVETFNPAMRLYKQLGFELADITNGVYHLFEWKAKEPILL